MLFVFFVENNFTTLEAPPSYSACTPEMSITRGHRVTGVPTVTLGQSGSRPLPGEQWNHEPKIYLKSISCIQAIFLAAITRSVETNPQR